MVNPQRSGDVPMLELRLHQLSVTSGFRVPTEEAVEFTAAVKTAISAKADGSIKGASAIATQQFGQIITNIFEDAVSVINSFVDIGSWWPLYHFVVDLILSSDVSLFIHITLDLLASVDIQEFDIAFFGVQMMSLQQGEEIVNVIDAETIWSRVRTAMIGITATLFMVTQLMAHFLTPAWESLFWVTLGAFLTSFVFTLALLVWETRIFNLDPVQKAIHFFFAALLTLGPSVINYAIVAKMSGCSGWNAITKYFGDTYYKGTTATKNKGFKGRSHVGLMLAQMACLISVIIIASGFALNVW